MIRASILGGSGYTGGELLRLLLSHPGAEVAQVTSRSSAGKFVFSAHPNLRGRTQLKFVTPDQLEKCDVLFMCLPHGEATKQIEKLSGLAERVVDLSADFRLKDPGAYKEWYGWEHPAPAWLDRFVYGLPELERERLRGARFASGVGCNATATNLAVWPLACKGLIERVVCEVKVGSSEGGAEFSQASHHPERSGAMRSFAPTGHRHQAEVLQQCGAMDLHLSVTSVEAVRGVLATAHVFLKERMDEKAVWQAFREAYQGEPFVRIVKDRQGIHRYPDPKILAGANFADVGFEVDERTGRVVCLGAIDNLMKGAAGSAVQCMNLMCGLEETAGLGFPGLHPV